MKCFCGCIIWILWGRKENSSWRKTHFRSTLHIHIISCMTGVPGPPPSYMWISCTMSFDNYDALKGSPLNKHNMFLLWPSQGKVPSHNTCSCLLWPSALSLRLPNSWLWLSSSICGRFCLEGVVIKLSCSILLPPIQCQAYIATGRVQRNDGAELEQFQQTFRWLLQHGCSPVRSHILATSQCCAGQCRAVQGNAMQLSAMPVPFS